MRRPRCVPFLLLLLLLLPALLLTPLAGDAAVITGACEKDSQCGGGMCCAVSIWVKSIRICTPMGKVGDSCHPLARKIIEKMLVQMSEPTYDETWCRFSGEECTTLARACQAWPVYGLRLTDTFV